MMSSLSQTSTSGMFARADASPAEMDLISILGEICVLLKLNTQVFCTDKLKLKSSLIFPIPETVMVKSFRL